MMERPEPRLLTTRQREIIAAARSIMDDSSWDELSMRVLAARLGIRAPSLYKHVASRAELAAWIVEGALFEMGDALHAAIAGDDPAGALLATYREMALSDPGRYRLTTGRDFRRDDLIEGLEEWSGAPFWLVTGNPATAQAMFAMAHGLVIMELDFRLPPSSDLAATWRAGGQALARG